MAATGLANMSAVANATAPPTSMVAPLWAIVIRWTLGSIIFLVGSLGNIMVCVVVYRNQRMQSAMNLFLVNLAVWDILVCFFNLPFTLIYFQTFPEWPFGLFWCKTLPTLQVMNLIASTGSLVAVTVERYRAICLPFTPPLSKFQAKLAIGLVWMASLLIALPEVGAYQLDPQSGCQEEFPNMDLQRAYSLFLFLGVYVIPLLFIFPLYMRMIYKLWNNRRGRNTGGVLEDPRDICRRRRVLKMMAIVVTCFAVCMMPNYVLFLIVDYGTLEMETILLLLPFCQLMAFTNSCINPVIYWLLSDEFSRGFKRLLSCNRLNSWSRQQSTSSSSDERRVSKVPVQKV